jgi:CheY-like chemotaxis protein
LLLFAGRPVKIDEEDVMTTKAVTHGHVLLVEDHHDTLYVLRSALTRCGYRVTTASSVHAALSAASDSEFDALVSDIGLPDGTGHEIVRALAPIPAIAISGFSGPDDVSRSLEAGFSRHLVKPITLDHLLTWLGSVVPDR